MARGKTASAVAPIPMNSGRFDLVPVCDVSSSELNPRRHFNDDAHAELVESVRKHGVLQPILVRPLPGGGFEIVAGERRHRAARAAGLVDIPAIVREMDDREALEVAVIENLQRADLHPLEEADGYRRLIDGHGYHVEQLAAKVGKSKAYVYARLKLAELGLAARELFHAGRLDASTALLVARMANPAQADVAARVIAGRPQGKTEEQEWRQAGGREEYSGFDDELEPWDEGKVEPGDFDDDNDPTGAKARKPLTFRQAQAYVRRRFMLRLEDAPFDPADASLVPAAGACAACPKRTGNQPELFPDVRNGDVCTDFDCFATKRLAHRDRLAEEARAAGKRVLTAKETKGVLSYGSVIGGSGYAEPKGECPIDPQGRTWPQVLKALGKHAPQRAVAIDGDSGQARELVKVEEVASALKARGVEPVKVGSANRAGDGWKEQQEAERRKRAIATAERDACVAAIVAKVEKAKDLPAELLTVIALAMAGGAMDGADWAPMLVRRGLAPPPEPAKFHDIDVDQVLRKAIPGLEARQLRGLLVDMAITADQPGYGKALGLLEIAAKALGIELKPIRKAAADAERKRQREEQKAAKANVTKAKDRRTSTGSRTCDACGARIHGMHPDAMRVHRADHCPDGAAADAAAREKSRKPKKAAANLGAGRLRTKAWVKCRACGERIEGKAPDAMRAHVRDEHPDDPTCVGCGCQESCPCPGGCFWVTSEPDEHGDEWCTSCHDSDEDQAERAARADEEE